MSEYTVNKYSIGNYTIFLMNIGLYLYYTIAYNLSDTYTETRFRLFLAYIITGYILIFHQLIYIIQWNMMVGYEFPNQLNYQYWKNHLGLNKFFPISTNLILIKFSIGLSIVYYNWDYFISGQNRNIAEFALYILNISTFIILAIITIAFLSILIACCLCTFFTNIDFRKQIVSFIPIDLPIISNKVADDVCGICLDNPENSTWIELPACKHRFHQECINTYLRHPNSSQNCPFCRIQIVLESAV